LGTKIADAVLAGQRRGMHEQSAGSGESQGWFLMSGYAGFGD
jgi:hypothetical protein